MNGVCKSVSRSANLTILEEQANFFLQNSRIVVAKKYRFSRTFLPPQSGIIFREIRHDIWFKGVQKPPLALLGTPFSVRHRELLYVLSVILNLFHFRCAVLSFLLSFYMCLCENTYSTEFFFFGDYEYKSMKMKWNEEKKDQNLIH